VRDGGGLVSYALEMGKCAMNDRCVDMGRGGHKANFDAGCNTDLQEIQQGLHENHHTAGRQSRATEAVIPL
jgi:hypothetical protein